LPKPVIQNPDGKTETGKNGTGKMMPRRFNARAGLLKLVACALMIAGCMTGCSQTVRHPVAGLPQQAHTPAATALYQQALDAYMAENYEGSVKAFDSVFVQSSNSSLGVKALYGSACAQLMIAETAEEYRDALARWNNWLQIASSADQEKELLLMAPIIREKMIFSEIVASMEDPDQNEHGPSIPLWLYNYTGEKLHRMKAQWASSEKALKDQRKRSKALANETAAVKEQIKVLEAQNKELESRINDMTFQIRDLESQIKAVEIIDQNIQKKKSAIPVAN
jgi:hypothetical protein